MSGRFMPNQVNFAIDAFFAAKEKALQLEKDLRGSRVAVLMVVSNGSVTLKDVVE
jgi:hypothetical protein